MNHVDMPLDSIIIPPRKRSIDQDKANGLASSMAQNGLINPITLKDDGTLLAGLYRIEAAKILNWQTIPAITIAGLDALHAELIEIDENLIRDELTPLQQGGWLNRRNEILTELGLRARIGGQPNNGNAAKNEGVIMSPSFFQDDESSEESTPPKTTQQIAEEAGMSERAAQRCMQIDRDLSQEVKDLIIGTELEEGLVELLNLSRLDPDLQLEVTKRILDGQAGNVDDAKKQIKKERRQLEQAQMLAIIPQECTITLHCADSLVFVPTLTDSSLALAVTDPPYNTTTNAWDQIGDDDDFILFTQQWLNAIRPKLALDYHLFFFCDPDYAAPVEMLLRRDGWPLKSRIIWEYRNLVNGRDATDKFIENWQMCFHIGTHKLNFSLDWDDRRFMVQQHATPQSNFTEGKYHPTQKPLSLIKLLVEVGSKPGDTILDLFAGSGTTGLACRDLKRDCILIEQDADYCRIIEDRLGLRETGN